jgi:hypothetical protein
MNGNFHWRGSSIGLAKILSAVPTDRMIVYIRSKIVDYYVHFNCKIGMNDGTQEGPNQVLVMTRPPGTGYEISKLGCAGYLYYSFVDWMCLSIDDSSGIFCVYFHSSLCLYF